MNYDGEASTLKLGRPSGDVSKQGAGLWTLMSTRSQLTRKGYNLG